MYRTYVTFKVKDFLTFRRQMLNWANQFSICCLLDNNNYSLPYHSYQCLLAVGSLKEFSAGADFFKSLQHFYASTNDWIFGHFSYDLKNKIEELNSSNPDYTGFPETFLFVPEVVLQLTDGEVSIGLTGVAHHHVFEEIEKTPFEHPQSFNVPVKARVSRKDYTATVERLKEHILRGDCYEINYCVEFFANNTAINPADIYNQLSTISPNPFSCFYKVNDKYLLCASPERYLKKESNKIISQPIKGTIERHLTDVMIDGDNKNKLKASAKERSENVMIVDLVRNDLSKFCVEGSVKVSELFGIYTFPQVHQMISTIEGELNEGVGLSEILRATFPMGSMTGAPKRRVMELIEDYEETKRGIYSGTVGYITPEKNFDFNVVIRSIVYAATEKYLSYHVGSAITYNSNPQHEYEECLLKASAIKKVLQHATP